MKYLLLLTFLITSCTVYNERESERGQVLASYVSIGTDAQVLNVTTPQGGGVEAIGQDQSSSVQHVGRTVTGVASIQAMRDVSLAGERTEQIEAGEITKRTQAREATTQALSTDDAAVDTTKILTEAAD